VCSFERTGYYKSRRHLAAWLHSRVLQDTRRQYVYILIHWILSIPRCICMCIFWIWNIEYRIVLPWWCWISRQDRVASQRPCMYIDVYTYIQICINVYIMSWIPRHSATMSVHLNRLGIEHITLCIHVWIYWIWNIESCCRNVVASGSMTVLKKEYTYITYVYMYTYTNYVYVNIFIHMYL